MKPLNADNPGCTPISSDCVIWQGPDIECINLCKGDTVSNVVNKLALQLCSILDTLNVDSYDLSCLNLTDCSPGDFQALLQLLIEKICALEGIDPTTPSAPGTGGCPDCVVNIAPCFHYTNPQGDTETTMQLIDYVTAIGNQLCTLVGQLDTVDSTLNNHAARIADLENAPVPTLTLPNLVPVCVLPPDLTPMDQVVQALEQQFCDLRSATGLPNDIYAALAAQCVGLSASAQLQGPGNMSDIAGWNSTVSDLSQGFTNMWLTLCDIRAAIQSIQTSCCTGTNCDDLDIEVEGVVVNPDNLTLFFTGTFPTGYSECNVAGSVVTITDSQNNSLTVTVPITPNLNTPTGFNVVLTSTPINPASNLIVSVPLCYSDGESECQKVITDIVVNDSACPTLNLVPSETTLNYDFTYLGGAASLNVVVYDVTGTSVIASQITVVVGAQSVAGVIVGLTAGVQYKVRLEITVGTNPPTLCPFASMTTLTASCLAPNGSNASLNVT